MQEQSKVQTSRLNVQSRELGPSRAVILIAAGIATAISLSPTAVHGKAFDNGAATLRYDTGTNWDNNVLPTSTDPVVFDNSLTTLSGTTVLLGSNALADSWTLGSGTGTALGAFGITSSGSSGRAVTLGSGAITVDSSVTGTQSIATAQGTLTFTSGTGTLTITNNSTQSLAMQNIAFAAGTNLTFPSAGGAITLSVQTAPTVASLNGGYSTVTYGTAGTGSARTITINGTGSHSFAGVIAASNIALTVSGADNTFVQTLTGNNTYGGTTTVTAGALLVNGAQTAAGSVAVNGGTLGGSGSITQAAAVSRSATFAAGTKLSPGASAGTAGTFAINYSGASGSSVNLSAASNDSGAYLFDLATPGTSDKLIVTTGGGLFNIGTLDFADFTFNALAGFGAGTYVLFDGNSNATFPAGTPHSLVGTIGTATGTIGAYNATLSIDATNDDVLLTVVSVPEPATLGALGGMMTIGLVRRRRQA